MVALSLRVNGSSERASGENRSLYFRGRKRAPVGITIVIALAISSDGSLSEPLRRAAINLVLKRCSKIREQAGDTGRSGGD